LCKIMPNRGRPRRASKTGKKAYLSKQRRKREIASCCFSKRDGGDVERVTTSKSGSPKIQSQGEPKLSRTALGLRGKVAREIPQ